MMLRSCVAAMVLVAMAVAACGGGGSGTKPSATADADNRIIVVAENIQFDLGRLSARPGAVTIVLDNEDTGQPHNIQFFRGSSNDGESVGTTEIKNGPARDELAMQLEPGAYFYHCDVHPNMKGNLTVE
ncbi:MAG TPA: cupredoxin domain-containing protein [Dehalococcoidia bacterium]|jgi:plastocyanin